MLPSPKTGGSTTGQNSKIEWTTHTFNPWRGCTKVSEACKHGYAEAWVRRAGKDVWGPSVSRRFFGDKHWAAPLHWNAAAAGSNSRPRVFGASMADVFEDEDELIPHRQRLFDLLEGTPNLDWLLLTKRPENVATMARWVDDLPPQVWLGTTVELQKRAEDLLSISLRSPRASGSSRPNRCLAPSTFVPGSANRSAGS